MAHQTPAMPADDEADRVAKALMSFVRAEFEAPVHVVSGFIDLLIEDARQDGLEGYRSDVEKIKAAGVKLDAVVAKLLDTDTADYAIATGEIEDVSSKLRHDLRTPITAILGYGEMLSEEAREDGHDALSSTLDGMLDASRRLLGQIDAMVDLMRSQASAAAQSADASVDAPAVQQAAEAIRSVLFDQPELQTVIAGRILVVDDNVSNLDLLARRLTRDGHTVETCASGEEALGRMEAEPFDLLLLDLIMPGLNGIDVLRHLRARDATRSLPVIMVSAMEEVDGAVRCIEAGADDFLSKPLNPVLLRARINAALERKRLRDRDIEITERLEVERERSETLLRNVLPASVVDRLRSGETVIADYFDDVTILFCDLVGFTALAARLNPKETLDLLNGIFSEFDQIAALNGVEKIKTIGDAYMVAGGLPEPRPDHAAAVARMGLRLPEVVSRMTQRFGQVLDVRLGMHTGPVMAGIIGKHKFVYDVWGDTVNTASRMEHHGYPNRIHVTEAARLALGDSFAFDALPPMEIKGKGIMTTYLIR